MQITKQSSQILQSKVIDFLRFPLIIGVLFIHNATSTVTIPGVTFGTDAFMPVFLTCSNLFSQVLGRIAVPLFFFISGFLFFLNVKTFDTVCYKNKLQSRMKTLLTPYLFWNVLTICFYYLCTYIPATASFVNKEMDIHQICDYLGVCLLHISFGLFAN